MRIFTSLVSAVVLGLTSYFIILNFDPGDRYNLNTLPLVFFIAAIAGFCFSLFVFVYSLINSFFKRKVSSNELIRRGILFTIPPASIIGLKIFGLLEHNIFIGLIVFIIPFFIEWFYLELFSRKKEESV